MSMLKRMGEKVENKFYDLQWDARTRVIRQVSQECLDKVENSLTNAIEDASPRREWTEVWGPAIVQAAEQQGLCFDDDLELSMNLSTVSAHFEHEKTRSRGFSGTPAGVDIFSAIANVKSHVQQSIKASPEVREQIYRDASLLLTPWPTPATIHFPRGSPTCQVRARIYEAMRELANSPKSN